MPVIIDDMKSRQKASEDVDNSLRGGAMRRALMEQVPKTLTPYEWQQWYAEYGVPPTHRRADKWSARQWRRVKKVLARMASTERNQ